MNVLVPAHYLVPFSRLGAYDRTRLDNLVYRDRLFTEQWAHVASIVPAESWPLLAHRREQHEPWGGQFRRYIAKNRDYVASVLSEVRSRGRLAADDLEEPAGAPRRKGAWWSRSIPKLVLEYHFGRGDLAIADRRSDMARWPTLCM